MKKKDQPNGSNAEAFVFPDKIKDKVEKALSRPTRFDMEGKVPRPLWVVFPNVERLSMHWRMGGGEDYKSSYYDWYASLSENERIEYKEKFPEPIDWKGFYDKLDEEAKWREENQNR